MGRPWAASGRPMGLPVVRPRGWPKRPLAAILGVGFAASGCMPAAVSSQGRAIHDLYTVFLAAAAVVAAIVWGLTTWSIIRYRKRGSEPPQIHGHLGLEIVWTALPILTVLVLFGLTFSTLSTVEGKGQGGVNVSITAFRWQWQFDYPDEHVTVSGAAGGTPELVVPVNEPIHVTLTSPDVDHAFFVPAFLFKRDAIPGHPTQFDFTVEQAGAYGGQCAEFCGVFHDRMLLTVRAVSRPDYDAWVASHRSSP